MKKILKNNIKLFIGIIIGLMLAVGVVYATTSGYLYDSDEVGYNNQTSGLTATDVQSALDELNAKAAGSNLTFTQRAYFTLSNTEGFACCGELSGLNSEYFTITGKWVESISQLSANHYWCDSSTFQADINSTTSGQSLPCTRNTKTVYDVGSDSPVSGGANTDYSWLATKWMKPGTMPTPKEVTVTLDANGGDFYYYSGSVCTSCGTKKVNVGDPYGYRPNASSLTTIQRDGYSFAGWYSARSGGSVVSSYTLVTNSQDHSIYAHWTGNSYTVTARASDGISSYDGWNVGNTSTVYVDGSESTTSYSSSFTVGYNYLCTAQPTHSGSEYSCEAMTSNEARIACTDSSVTKYWLSSAADCSPVRPGGSYPYVCKYTGSGSYSGSSCRIYDRATYYRSSSSQLVTSVYKSVTMGQPYGTLPTATGKTGWYTEQTGGTQVTSSTNVSTSSNHTIYAR